MDIRLTTLVFALCLSPFTRAQQQDISQPRVESLPEEVVVSGDRSLMQLRTQMTDAEKNAYDIFNRFNDEKRFMISCSMNRPTGRLYEVQVCKPEFERRALGTHGQAFLANYQNYINSLVIVGMPNTDGSVNGGAPFEAIIASQQQEYREKMRQVAQEHPEFLEAIIRYSNLRQQYEETTDMSDSE